MQEEIVTIGNGFKLSGIVGIPENLDTTKPTVVILNSGLMHRVGTSRTSVKLSRSLVNEGYLVVRFDLSGIGDSEVRTVDIDPVDRIIQEVSSVLDYIEQYYDVKKFVLYGLCSGAQNSFKTALKDKRVVGLAGVDNFGFRTKRYYLNDYLPKFFQLSHWKSFLISKLNSVRLFIKRIFLKEESKTEENLWPYPPKEFVERGYGELVKRGMRFLYIYTGSWSNQYNYLNQFYDMYPSVKFNSSVDLRFKPEMNHTMTELDAQNYMIETVSHWLNSQDWFETVIN